MPQIACASAADGYILASSSVSWSAARDATSGTGSSSSITRSTTAIRASATAGRGGGTNYIVNRSFFTFDCSEILTPPHYIELSLYKFVTNSADFFVLKGTQGGTLSLSKFDAIDGWSTSGVDNEGNVTKFSEEVTSLPSARNRIALNGACAKYVVSNNRVQLALVESVHDLRNVAPTANYSTGIYYTDYTGTDYAPYLSYETGAGLWMELSDYEN